MNIAAYIDHTILKANTTPQEVQQFCQEALHYGFAAVCIPPYYVSLAKNELNNKINIATVIGFPLGYASIESKRMEIIQAIKEGADEIDFVINQCALAAEDLDYLKQEILKCIEPVRLQNKKIKIILETGMLNEEQIINCCKLYSSVKVDFLKTSTGFAPIGAEISSIQLMKKNLPKEIKLKASGGIRTNEFAKELIQAGADRIGTSSGVLIMENK